MQSRGLKACSVLEEGSESHLPLAYRIKGLVFKALRSMFKVKDSGFKV